jgi:transketolase
MNRVVGILGDGECQEGQVWEAAMSASHYKTDNLTIIIDRNGLQIDGNTEDVMRLGSLEKKWASFGWFVQEIDGHNFDDLQEAMLKAESKKGKPSVIIATTVKGKDVSFMEHQSRFHGAPCNDDEYEIAMNELSGSNS